MSELQPPPTGGMDPARIRRASAVLARAFQDYPQFRHLFPEQKRRARALLWYMGFVLRYCSRYGAVLATAGDEGVLTLLTGPQQFTRRKLLAAGFLLGLLRMGPAPFWRMVRHNNHVGVASARFIPPGAWYLWLVGVDPAVRWKRLGWELMQRAVDAADAAGAACYCDTERREMVGFMSFYEFQVVYEEEAGAGGPPFWVLCRPARPARPLPGEDPLL